MGSDFFSSCSLQTFFIWNCLKQLLRPLFTWSHVIFFIETPLKQIIGSPNKKSLLCLFWVPHISLTLYFGTLANSIAPDETPQNAVSLLEPILFANRYALKILNENEQLSLIPKQMKWSHPNEKAGKVHSSHMGSSRSNQCLSLSPANNCGK